MNNNYKYIMRFAAFLVGSVLSMDMTAAQPGAPQPVYGYTNVLQAITNENQYGQRVDTQGIATNPVDRPIVGYGKDGQPIYGNRVLGEDISTIADENLHVYSDRNYGGYKLHERPQYLARSNQLTPKQRKQYNSDRGHAHFMNKVDENAQRQEAIYQKWRQWTQGTSVENTRYPGPHWERDPFIMRRLEREKPELFVTQDGHYGGSSPQNWANVDVVGGVGAVMGLAGLL